MPLSSRCLFRRIYACQAGNSAITGCGTRDGGGDETGTIWRDRQRADRDRLRALGAAGVRGSERGFGGGHFLRFGLVRSFGGTPVRLEDLGGLAIDGALSNGAPASFFS